MLESGYGFPMISIWVESIFLLFGEGGSECFVKREKMKSMENDDNADLNNQNNWLGFSLSPQMHNIGVSSHSQPSSAAEVVPTSFYHHTAPLSSYGFYYGLEAENVGLYSALPIMPLKSDGSLYGMEAVSRSQAQG